MTTAETMNPIRPREDQFVGALVGCAVGDALGAPFENSTCAEIAEVTDPTTEFRPFGKQAWQRAAGQYTADTQQAVAIARSMVDSAGVDGTVIAAEFVRLWKSGEIVGQGPVADRAVQRLMAGVP